MVTKEAPKLALFIYFLPEIPAFWGSSLPQYRSGHGLYQKRLGRAESIFHVRGNFDDVKSVTFWVGSGLGEYLVIA